MSMYLTESDEEPSLPDYKYKIILLGEPNVGKTTCTLRLKYNRFIKTKVSENFRGAGMVLYNANVDGEEFKVRFDEPAGTERHHSITRTFYRYVDAVIFVYSVFDEYTFEGLEYISRGPLDDVVLDKNVTWAIFGNKSDLGIKITDLSGKVGHFSERLLESTELHDLHFVLSAKTGAGFLNAVDDVISEVHRKKMASSLATGRMRGISVAADQSAVKLYRGSSKSSCCSSDKDSSLVES